MSEFREFAKLIKSPIFEKRLWMTLLKAKVASFTLPLKITQSVQQYYRYYTLNELLLFFLNQNMGLPYDVFEPLYQNIKSHVNIKDYQRTNQHLLL